MTKLGVMMDCMLSVLNLNILEIFIKASVLSYSPDLGHKNMLHFSSSITMTKMLKLFYIKADLCNIVYWMIIRKKIVIDWTKWKRIAVGKVLASFFLQPWVQSPIWTETCFVLFLDLSCIFILFFFQNSDVLLKPCKSSFNMKEPTETERSCCGVTCYKLYSKLASQVLQIQISHVWSGKVSQSAWRR